MGDKVLVVDDELDIRSILSDFLPGEGYRVLLAVNGEEAIDLAKRENPQAILLDVRMPGIDGVETCRRLKAEEKTKFIPVIMITAYTDNKMDAIDAGADDFVYKPLDLLELSIRIKSILRMRYLNDEIEKLAGYIKELEKNIPQR